MVEARLDMLLSTKSEYEPRTLISWSPLKYTDEYYIRDLQKVTLRPQEINISSNLKRRSSPYVATRKSFKPRIPLTDLGAENTFNA